MTLTEKQIAALREARSKNRIFQLPERRRHSPALLAKLVNAGLLKREPVGVIWSLTTQGEAALSALANDKKKD